MYIKSIFTTVILTLFMFDVAICENTEDKDERSPTDRGAVYISGHISGSNSGGDLYEVDGHHLEEFTVVPSVLYFVASGLGFGADISLHHQKQGDFSFTTVGVGPKAGYFFGSGGTAIPFLTTGAHLLSMRDDFGTETGFGFKFGGGLILRSGNLAFSLGVSIAHQSINFDDIDETITGEQLLIDIGIGGFLY